MLTDAEVRLLLGHAMAYDARLQPGEATVAAWTEASRRGRWTYDEALEVTHQHYAESTDWLMPGTITQRIRSARNDRAMREAAKPARQPDAIGQRRIEELTTGAFQTLNEPTAAAPAKPALVRSVRRHVRLDPELRAQARAELDAAREGTAS